MTSVQREETVRRTVEKLQQAIAKGCMLDLQRLLRAGLVGLDNMGDEELQQACEELLVNCVSAPASEQCGSIAPDRYLVQWEIDIEDADSPREAALRAQACQQRAGTTATVFSVTDRHTGRTHVVDLDDGGEIDLVLPGLSSTQVSAAARAS